MSETDKQEIKIDENSTLGKVHALQQRFYAACGELYENVEYIGEPLYKIMLEHYYAQYKREYDLMNAAEFIETDKIIEQLKIERARELEQIRLEYAKLQGELQTARTIALEAIQLERDKLAAELAVRRDEELEAVQLEHERLLAEIKLKKISQNEEIDILARTAEEEAKIKLRRIIPAITRRYRIGKIEFGPWETNKAMEIALNAVELDIQEYLTSRAETVNRRYNVYRNRYCTTEAAAETEESSESDEEEPEELIAPPEPMDEVERKKWLKQFAKEERARQKAEAKQAKRARKQRRNAQETAETAESEQTDDGENEPAGAAVESEEGAE